jgi:hypothetical protein
MEAGPMCRLHHFEISAQETTKSSEIARLPWLISPAANNSSDGADENAQSIA